MRRSASLAILLTAACGPFEASDCTPGCAGDELCIAGACEPAFPRQYTLIAEASLATKDPDGLCWDEPFCGDPDPLVAVVLDGRELGRTGEATGVYTHRFTSEPIVVTLDGTGTLELVAYDVDVDFNDVAARCAQPVSVELVRSGLVRCASGVGESLVSATIEP